MVVLELYFVAFVLHNTHVCGYALCESGKERHVVSGNEDVRTALLKELECE